MKKEALSKKGQIIPFIYNGEYFFQRGLTFYRQQQYEKAKKYIYKAMDLEPKNPTYICQYAAIQSQLGEYSESNQWLEYLLEKIDANVTECHYFLANNYIHLELFDEAERQASEYLQKDPRGPFAEEMKELIPSLVEEQDNEEKLDHEDELILSHEQARHHMEKGDFQTASDILENVVRKHPDYWAAYNNLSLAYFYNGQEEKAIETLKMVLAKNDGNLHALCNLTLFYHWLGQTEERDHLLAQLKKVHPLHPDDRYKLGSTFGLLKAFDSAYKWLSSIRQYSYDGDVVYFHWLAVSAFATGRTKVAERAWEKVIDLDRDGEVAPYYLKKLRAGSLSPEEVDSEYRLPKNDQKSDASAFDTNVEASEKAKFIHLFILDQDIVAEGYETLVTFCKHKDEAFYLKELAACVMLNHEPNRPVIITVLNEEIIINDPSELSPSAVDTYRVYKEIRRLFTTDELNEWIYNVWTDLYAFVYTKRKRFKNATAWAAAMAYIWQKTNERPITRQEVADFYGVSVSTVSNYVQKFKQLLDEL